MRGRYGRSIDEFWAGKGREGGRGSSYRFAIVVVLRFSNETKTREKIKQNSPCRGMFSLRSFPPKVERPLASHGTAASQVHGGGMHGAYSSGSQTSLSTSYITGQSYMQGQNYASSHGPYATASVQVAYPHNAAAYSQPQSYGTMVQGYGGQPQSAGYQQNHLKKGSVRNGDVLKRCRLQTA